MPQFSEHTQLSFHLLWVILLQGRPCKRHRRQHFWEEGILYGGGENSNPLQYSCLENPVDRRAWWAAVHGVAQSRTQLMQLSMHACIGEGNSNPLQYSCLENPRDGGAWWAAVYGVAKSQRRLKRLSSSSPLWTLLLCPSIQRTKSSSKIHFNTPSA